MVCTPEELQNEPLQELFAVFGRYYKPKPSILEERFKFHNRKHMTNESIAEYEAEPRR